MRTHPHSKEILSGLASVTSLAWYASVTVYVLELRSFLQLHDGVSSLSRMFYGAVSDFFAQAVISYILGHRNLSVFSEFLEKLQSSEEFNLIKLSRVRAAASMLPQL